MVVGGGITGITAAYLLKKAGYTVALIERDRFAQVDTGHTTAHLTYVTDERLTKLVKHFGEDHARAVWDAGHAAMQQIEEIVAENEIDCEFRHVPGFLHSSLEGKKDETKSLRDEAVLAQKLGFDAAFLPRVPFFGLRGCEVCQPGQVSSAQVPRGLLKLIPGDGCEVYEQSEVTEFHEKPLGVTANGHRLDCDYVVIATHVPLMGNTGLISATLFQTKLAPYSRTSSARHCPKERFPKRRSGTRAIRITICAWRSEPTQRLCDLRRRRSQDGPGNGHRRAIRQLGGEAAGAYSRSKARSPLVGTGDRNQRRPAVHRRDR